MTKMSKKLMLLHHMFCEYGEPIVQGHKADVLIDCAKLAECDCDYAIVMYRKNGTELFPVASSLPFNGEEMKYYAENDKTAKFWMVNFGKWAARDGSMWAGYEPEDYCLPISRNEALAYADLFNG